MRDAEGGLSFAPRLPQGLRGLRFRTRHRGSCLEVSVGAADVRYALVEGGPVQAVHHGERFTVDRSAPVVLAIPPAAEEGLTRPRQPRHLEPRRRR